MRVIWCVLFSVALAVSAVPAQATPPTFNGDVISKTVPVYNVKAYGAKGDGVTSDTTAINSAITAANSAGGGIVFLPAGTYYLGTGPITPLSNVWIAGAGIAATTITLNGALTGGNADGIRFSIANGGTYLTGVRLSDLTVDATNQTQGNAITLQGWNRLRVEHVRVINPFGYGIVVGSNGGATPSQYSQDLYMNDIYVSGERNGNDSIGGGSILRGIITNYYSLSGNGTCSDLVNITDFIYKGILCYRTGTPISGADGLDIDSGATNVTYDDIHIDGARQGMVIASSVSTGGIIDTNVKISNFTIRNVQDSAIYFNSASGLGPNGVTIADGYISNWNILNTASQAIIFAGGSNIDVHDVTYGSPANAAYAIRLNNDAGGANPPSNVSIHDNNLLAAAPNLIQFTAFGSNIRINKNLGFNPIGASIQGGQPAVPASGTAVTNTYFSDCTVYVQANGATMSTATQVGGNSINGFTTGSFVVPAGSTIKVFYTAGTPAWQWICN